MLHFDKFMKLPEKIIKKWPKWVPYPQAWVRSIAAITFLVPFLLSAIPYDPSNPATEDKSFAILVVLSAFYALIYAVLNHKLTGGKGWTPALCLWKANYSIFVSIVGIIPAVLLGMGMSKEVYYYGQKTTVIPKDGWIATFITYITITVFLFHWENLLGLWINKLKNKRRKKQEFEQDFLNLKEEVTQNRREKIKKSKRKTWIKRKK